VTASDGGTDAGGGSEADGGAPTTSVPPAPPKGPDIWLPLFRYPGKEPDFVVIVAGIHTSEQSGVEVARWINATLAARPKPTRLGALIIPEVFPQYGIRARKKELKVGAAAWNKPDKPESDEFREFRDAGKVWRFPNRHFPPPGFPLAALKKGVLLTLGRQDQRDESQKAIPMLPQIRQVVELIEWVKPVRIVSIHGNHSARLAGIFVDSRYAVCVKDGFALENCKFDLAKDPAYPKETQEGVAKQFASSRTEQGRDDDKLARRLADAVAVNDETLVLGNHLSDPEPRVHYHEKQADKEKKPNELGYSLGDWGPVDVVDGRPGAPVFTIETYQNHESWAFDGATGAQRMDERGQPLKDPLSGRVYLMQPTPDRGRAKQLHGLAQAIINVILDS
jgi:hypothetical protein